MSLYTWVQRFHEEEAGQDLVEYALVLAAVAFAVVAGSSVIAGTLKNAMGSINDKLSSAVSNVS